MRIAAEANITAATFKATNRLCDIGWDRRSRTRLASWRAKGQPARLASCEAAYHGMMARAPEEGVRLPSWCENASIVDSSSAALNRRAATYIESRRAAWAAELGVADRVDFRGHVSHEDKCKLTQLADAYTSTSTHEGFGLVFVEAMDRGVPIVSFNRGGHVDYLIDGETGGVAPLGDIDAFAERVTKLKNDDAFRAQCAAHVKEKAKLYHIGVCAGRYEELFEQTIARWGNQAPAAPSQAA